MPFATGLILIDAPAAALNNLGEIQGERVGNTSGVKVIKVAGGYTYPYVSAQAFRHWLRTTAEKRIEGWKTSPITRDETIAYTEADPRQWWDDDLFGYMRVPKKQPKGAQGDAQSRESGKVEMLSRVSPFRVGTLVSLSPVMLTSDFGVMARQQEGYPVLYEHQFYRTTLQGLFSLDLHACGTFSYRQKAGFRNLDEVRAEKARQAELEHLETEKAFRLPLAERIQRIQGLFESMALLEGGAKQALHYTDVAPVFCLLAITRGGNHIFGHLVGATKQGIPEIKQGALKEALTSLQDEILSPLYIGWTRGYLDEQREQFERDIAALTQHPIVINHPREVLRVFTQDLAKPEHASWLS